MIDTQDLRSEQAGCTRPRPGLPDFQAYLALVRSLLPSKRPATTQELARRGWAQGISAREAATRDPRGARIEWREHYEDTPGFLRMRRAR